ncbi:MAG TPA: peroxiredoxin-like family protein [Sphingobacteriaceae bacterium]
MPLKANSKAPLFNLVDIYGRQIDLGAYKSKRLLLGFFRHAGCPFCNLRVHTLQKVYQELKDKNFEMIFFFESKEQVMLRSTFHQGVSPIPLISDPQKKIYSAYGLEASTKKALISHATSFAQTVVKATAAKVPVHMMAEGESFSTMPAEFLIDHDLVIKRAHYSERLNHRIVVDDIRVFADKGVAQEAN